MLSLGPGSGCDVCLEPFGADSKTPCSIPCGHVFCVNCLQQVARPTCPLCRTPFDGRQIIKLHVDLDSIRAPTATEEKPVFASTDDQARHLQAQIIALATTGASEAYTTQLVEECKAFLDTIVTKTMYADLRTSYNMLKYIRNVKKLHITQGLAYKQLQTSNTTLGQDIDRLKAAVEALKLEKKKLEGVCHTVSAERDDISAECAKLQEQVSNAEAHIQFITEQNETAQNQLVLLHEEIQRLRMMEPHSDFSSPEGDSPVDMTDLHSDLTSVAISSALQWPHAPVELDGDSEGHDPSAPFLTPWEGVIESKHLPDADGDSPQNLLDEPLPMPMPMPMPMPGTLTRRTLCGAAGCPHSCDCMPFVLFSPGSRQAQAQARNADGLVVMPQEPSGLSLSLHRNHSRSRSHSRSHSRPRSRSLSRAPSPHAYSPSSSSNNPSQASPPSSSMSMSINIPNANGNHQPGLGLRGQLEDLLTDPGPISSSLPNMPMPMPMPMPSTSGFYVPPSPSPLARELRHGSSSPRRPAHGARDRGHSIARESYPQPSVHPPMMYGSSAKDRPRESYPPAHPPMVYGSVGAGPAYDYASERAPPPTGKARESSSHVHPPMLYGSPADNSRTFPPLGKPRDVHGRPHPPMPYASPLHTSSPLAEPSTSNSQRPSLYRSNSGAYETQMQQGDKERRRTEKTRTSHPPMVYPPSPSPAQGTPPPRLSLPPVSGLRLSAPAMPVPSNSTLPPPVHSHSLPAAYSQPPSPPTYTGTTSAPRSPTKASPPGGSSQPRERERERGSAAVPPPASSSAGAGSRGAYGVPVEHARRMDTTDAGAHAAYGSSSSRGTSRRVHAPTTTMAPVPNPLYA